MKLGAKTILDYAKRFGFYKTPPLETPANERAPSGTTYTKTHRSDDPKTASKVDPGRLAFGQCDDARDAAPDGDGRRDRRQRRRRPEAVPRPEDRRAGRLDVTQTQPGNLGRAIKPETAADADADDGRRRQGGTGTAAQIPGIQVAGKTGTAETGVDHVYTAWFVCFAPADNPQVAVAVVLEKQLNGFGGAVAAPIAKPVLQALLHG